MAAGCHLEFDPTGNGAVRSAVPHLTINMKSSDDVSLRYGRLKFSKMWVLLALVVGRSVINIHTSYSDLFLFRYVRNVAPEE